MSDQHGDELLAWIGRYASYAHRAEQGPASGMRAGISLTARRGPDAREGLLRMGVADTVMDEPVLYRDFVQPAAGEPGYLPGASSIGMLGGCGQWTYILENDLAATWYLAQLLDPGLVARADEEIVCVSLNHHDLPGTVAYSPFGMEDAWTAEFGRGFRESLFAAPEDPSGDLAAFDEALTRAEAVYSTLQDGRAWRDVTEDEWASAVYRAVGDRFGIGVDRAQVEQGLLAAVVLPLPE
ncbi:hypothetical protein [Streptomyces sp. NPDC049813]|uniref:hypothetical protein n=1 Tax=Streptomyces sp. NPDC049813 TaxID=3365597 RepID=UPI0037A1CB37